MEPYFEKGVWIAPPEPTTVAVFRKRFSLEALPESAMLRVTGLGYFEVYLNGSPITDDRLIPVPSDYFRRDFSTATYPVFDEFTHRIYFHSFEIGNFLKPGCNELKIVVGGGWFVQNERIAEGRMSYSDRPQCIFALQLGDEWIVSDGSELFSECEIRESNLFIGEVIDYTYPSDAQKPVITLPAPDAILTETDAVPDRIIRKIQPKLLYASNQKRIYDVGENISGLVALHTCGAYGDTYTLRYAEWLDSEGALRFASSGGGITGASGNPQIMTDVFVSDGQGRVFLPHFTWHAFRYFEIEGNCSGIEFAEVCEIRSALSLTAEFDSDSEGANFLFDAYVRTQLSNYHGSFPSDCPHRERLGYTGDGQVCAAAGMMLFDSKVLYRKWIRDILDAQDQKTGHVPHTAPFQGGGGGPCGWGGAIIAVPYAFVKQFGDRSILEKTLPAMRRYLGFIQSCMVDGLVVRETEGGWCLGDWEFLDSGKVPEPFVNTALLVGLIRQYHELSGEREYAQLEEQALDALKREYQELKHIGAATVWAAYVGIDCPEAPMRYYDRTGCFDTGFLATDVLVELLFQNGYADTAYKLLSSTKTGSFLEMKQRGATTLFEAWGCHRSGAHPMFGACTRSLFQGLLGIRQPQGHTGYQRICFTPALPSDMNDARGSILTPVGRISVHLARREGQVTATLTVPSGVDVLNCAPKSYTVHVMKRYDPTTDCCFQKE